MPRTRRREVHSDRCACTVCCEARELDQRDAGREQVLTVLCADDRRHKLGEVHFDAMSAQPSVTAREIPVLAPNDSRDPSTWSETQRPAAMLALSTQTYEQAGVAGRPSTVPRRLEWVCAACVAAGLIGAQTTHVLRLERLYPLVMAMQAGRTSTATVQLTLPAIDGVCCTDR